MYAHGTILFWGLEFDQQADVDSHRTLHRQRPSGSFDEASSGSGRFLEPPARYHEPVPFGGGRSSEIGREFWREHPKEGFGREHRKGEFGREHPKEGFGQEHPKGEFGREHPKGGFGREHPEGEFGREDPKEGFGREERTARRTYETHHAREESSPYSSPSKSRVSAESRTPTAAVARLRSALETVFRAAAEGESSLDALARESSRVEKKNSRFRESSTDAQEASLRLSLERRCASLERSLAEASEASRARGEALEAELSRAHQIASDAEAQEHSHEAPALPHM